MREREPLQVGRRHARSKVAVGTFVAAALLVGCDNGIPRPDTASPAKISGEVTAPDCLAPEVEPVAGVDAEVMAVDRQMQTDICRSGYDIATAAVKLAQNPNARLRGWISPDHKMEYLHKFTTVYMPPSKDAGNTGKVDFHTEQVIEMGVESGTNRTVFVGFAANDDGSPNLSQVRNVTVYINNGDVDHQAPGSTYEEFRFDNYPDGWDFSDNIYDGSYSFPQPAVAHISQYNNLPDQHRSAGVDVTVDQARAEQGSVNHSLDNAHFN